LWSWVTSGPFSLMLRVGLLDSVSIQPAPVSSVSVWFGGWRRRAVCAGGWVTVTSLLFAAGVSSCWIPLLVRPACSSRFLNSFLLFGFSPRFCSARLPFFVLPLLCAGLRGSCCVVSCWIFSSYLLAATAVLSYAGVACFSLHLHLRPSARLRAPCPYACCPSCVALSVPDFGACKCKLLKNGIVSRSRASWLKGRLGIGEELCGSPERGI